MGMDMKSYLYGLLSLFLLAGCASQSVEMPFPAFEQKAALKGEMLECKEIIAPDFIALKGKSMFVASSRSDTMLWRYELPDLLLQSGWGTKGQGKDEIGLFPMFCRSFSDTLYVWGYTPVTIKAMVADGQAMKAARALLLPQYDNFNQMHILRDSLLVYSTVSTDYTIKKINLVTGKPSGQITMERDEHGETFFDSHRGIMSANDDFIVYAYSYKKQIDLYRVSDMTLYKRLVDKDVKSEIRMGGMQHTVQRYLNVMAGRKYIYALYDRQENGCCLEVLDYEGRGVAQYSFDVAPFLFDVDEENNMLYGFNGNYENYFIRYKLLFD